MHIIYTHALRVRTDRRRWIGSTTNKKTKLVHMDYGYTVAETQSSIRLAVPKCIYIFNWFNQWIRSIDVMVWCRLSATSIFLDYRILILQPVLAACSRHSRNTLQRRIRIRTHHIYSRCQWWRWWHHRLASWRMKHYVIQIGHSVLTSARLVSNLWQKQPKCFKLERHFGSRPNICQNHLRSREKGGKAWSAIERTY